MSDAAFLAAGHGALEKVPHPSVKDAVAERFATLIASGVLAVGDTLPSERDLAAAMGVSRETVRAALLILSTKGIVTVVQGARTRVTSADLGDLGLPALTGTRITDYALEDVHEGRLMVEGRVAALAAERACDTIIPHLVALIAAQEAAMGDPVRFLIADREFHTALYRSCGNAVLADLASTLYSYQLDHRRRAVAKPGAIARSIADHRAILSALVARDGAALSHAMAVHERRIYDSTRALQPAAPEGAAPCG